MRQLTALVAATAMVFGGLTQYAHAQPTNPPDGDSGAVGAPGVPPTHEIPGGRDPNLNDDERDVLRDVEDQFQHFTDAADKHEARLRAEMRGELDQRIAALEKRYAEKIAKAASDRQKFRDSTKALLLKFIADHPDQEQFTPDARFRLAEIYLDESDEAVDAIDDPSAAVMADYTLSIEQWETILKDFPGYRQLPSVLYLLAYYGKSQGMDERRSLLLFLSLTCANRYKWTDPPPPAPSKQEALTIIQNKTYTDPYADCTPIDGADPELVRNAWVRGIADYHFNVPGELDGAISGYLQVADKAPDSNLYAESLYKLAWSYYKRDFLLESIKRFDQSVILYDKTIAAGQVPPLELRDESLQYIAVAFTDPWEGETDTDPVKAFARAEEFYKGREAEPHVRDVWVALGNAFLELQAYDQAVDSFRKAIGPPWELNPDNPVVHQQIVDAYEQSGDKAAADAAAGELATRYAPGTPWYQANEKNRAAMDNQRRIAERALYASALNTEAAAAEERKEWEAGGKKDEALHQDFLGLYQRAIGLFQTFIQQYPESDYIYQFEYMLGEALFFSGKYMESVEHYKWVRDHRDLSSDLFLDAAKSVLAAYQAEVDDQVAAGTIAPLKVPTADELKALPQPIQPQPIPQIYQDLRAEWDEYQDKVPDPASAPQQGINAALISVAYYDLDDAITRFEKVLAKFCGSVQAAKAKDGLLAIYDATGQHDKFQATNDYFINKKCGSDDQIRAAQSQNRSLEFEKADDLVKQKKFVEAAEAYYSYYKRPPLMDKNGKPIPDPDQPTALYNAAIYYKLGERPKTAISLFKEFTQSTDPAFRGSPYYLEAMRATALSYQSEYDYANAIKSYLDLYDVAKNAKKKGIKPPPPIPGEKAQTLDEISLDALYNAAVLSELNRDFAKAIKLYKQYEGEATDRRSKDRADWSVARIYSQQGDVSNLIAAYKAWRSLFGQDSGNGDDYIFSYYDVAKAYQKKGKSKDADDWANQTIKAFATIKGTPGSQGAKWAGEFSLMFAERQFKNTWTPYAIKKTPKDAKEAKKLIADLSAVREKTLAAYDTLDVYQVFEYTAAKQVRYGEVGADFGEKLRAMPVPKDIQKMAAAHPEADLLATWDTEISKLAQPWLDKAKELWQGVVDSSKKNQVSNQWSQLALEDLNREFPDEYPVLHQELYEGTDKP